MPCPHDPPVKRCQPKKVAARQLLLFLPLASGRRFCASTATQRARLRSPLNPPPHFRTAGVSSALLNLLCPPRYLHPTKNQLARSTAPNFSCSAFTIRPENSAT